MKKILILMAVLFAVQAVDAQVKTPVDAIKAVEAAKAATQNEKKATKVATWLKLAKTYTDAFESPKGNAMTGASKQELQLLMAGEKPTSSEAVELAGEVFMKEVYASRNLYFNQAGVLSVIEITKPVYENALELAVEAYQKAYEVDAKMSKTKDIVEGLKGISYRYQTEAFTQYYLNNLAQASVYFEKAAAALATEPSEGIDSLSIYNAGFTAWMVADYERAAQFLEESVKIGYLEEGEAYAKLADSYAKLEKKAEARAILEEGFSKFPQSQVLLIGLINSYIEANDNPDKLFQLMDEAKKNEPNNASLYYVEGNIHNQLGQKEEAIACYRKSNEINPEYEWGLIGIGLLHYNEAIEIQKKAAEELDDAKYQLLLNELEDNMKSAIEPFEKAYALSADPTIKVTIAEYLKNIYFAFRENGPEYAEGYAKYNEIVKTGVAN